MGVDVRLADDLHEWHPCAVEVQQAVAIHMEELGRVLFQMHSLDADAPGLPADLDLQPAVVAQRQVVLGDLVAFGEVGVGIVLAIPLGEFGDLAVEGQGGHDGVFDRLAVDDRQHPWHAQADGADVGVGRRGGVVGAAAAEHLGVGQQLNMDFNADDGFVLHGALLWMQVWVLERSHLFTLMMGR